MKLENMSLQLSLSTLTPQPGGGGVVTLKNGTSYSLNQNQFSYLQVLSNGSSITQLVDFYLGQGWLVSFQELYQLIEFLQKNQVIGNTQAHQEFSLQGQSQELSIEKNKLKIQQLPFLRSLQADFAEHLLKTAKIKKYAPQEKITQINSHDRSLFIVLKGQAHLYKGRDSERHRAAVLSSGAIFGERAFLLAQPRSADVVAQTECWLLEIPHHPQYDEMIKLNSASSLQHRFWVLQALQSSAFFKSLPSTSLDALIFSGRLFSAPAHQVLFNEGEVGQSSFILIQGSLVISQGGKNINVLTQGTSFGEISLLVSGGRRTASAQTQTECLFLEITQDSFYKILSQNILLAKEIEALAHKRVLADRAR